MQFWTELYKEVATRITDNLSEVRWVDLWHNQINFLQDEHPFPTPAVFLSFHSNNMEDAGGKVQTVILQIDFFIYYETFLDTFNGAYNQEGALAFIQTLDQLHALFHATSGNNYSSMRRLAFAPVDTGNSGNLYRISFECILQDYSAMKQFTDAKVKELAVSREVEVSKLKTKPVFKV